MASSHSSNNVPDSAHGGSGSNFRVADWAIIPVAVPRTLVFEDSLTTEEKMVGLFVHTVADNRSYGGEFYDWLSDDEGNADRFGLTVDEYLAAIRKLHDLGYITLADRPLPQSPTHREMRETDLAEVGREFERRKREELARLQEIKDAARAKVNSRKPIGPALRLAVYKADGYQCVVCKSNEDLEVDHIIPVIHGGTNARENLQTLCKPCNTSKGAKPMDEWMEGRA